MEALSLSARRMALEVQISTNTIGRFLNGESWPKAHQREMIERAIGWPSGALEEIATGGAIPEVSRTADTSRGNEVDSEVGVTVRPSGDSTSNFLIVTEGLDDLTPAQQALIRAKTEAFALELYLQLQRENEERELARDKDRSPQAT